MCCSTHTIQRERQVQLYKLQGFESRGAHTYTHTYAHIHRTEALTLQVCLHHCLFTLPPFTLSHWGLLFQTHTHTHTHTRVHTPPLVFCAHLCLVVTLYTNPGSALNPLTSLQLRLGWASGRSFQSVRGFLLCFYNFIVYHLATVATLTYLSGQLHINTENSKDIQKLWAKDSASPFWSITHTFRHTGWGFFCCLSSSPPYVPLHTHPTPSPTLLLLPQRWVSMNGEAVHSSSPAIKSSPPLFAFEVELLYIWARRLCGLCRLLHLKFGRAVTPAETWRRPGGSRLRAQSDEEDYRKMRLY